jgi:hypothetical protein
VELRGPPRLKTPSPPSNFQILNTHKEILIKNTTGLILDVGWFEVGTYLKHEKSQFFAWRNTSRKRNEHNTMLFVILTYI